MQRWVTYILKLQAPLVLTPEIVICNNYKGLYGDLINTLILITKQYIYATKCLKERLSSINLVQRFYKTQSLERIISLRNNKEAKFMAKWSVLE